jgi:F420-dependent oxidoreductase-like protein
MEVAIMIEGQNGLTWQRWMRLAQAVEDLGFAGLYRSDHFTNADPPNLDSLECWVSLTWLASHTRRIEFGSLVTPVSFRHPVFTARMALQVDDLSGGRLRLGVGAGWQVREHEMFGFDLLPERERFARFEEGLQVMTRLLKSDTPVSFEGKYYHLREAVLLPRPKRAGGPPLVIGGNGIKRTLPLVACYADEWNGLFLPAEKYQELSRILDTYLVENERDPQAVKRSLMTNLYFGRSQAELRDQLQGQSPEDLRAKGFLVGQAGEVVETLGRLEQAGVQRVMLQWLDLDALDGLEAFAKSVVAQVQ